MLYDMSGKMYDIPSIWNQAVNLVVHKATGHIGVAGKVKPPAVRDRYKRKHGPRGQLGVGKIMGKKLYVSKSTSNSDS